MGSTEMEVGADGVAVIRLVNPPVNDLSLDVLNSLKENYDQALQRDDVKAIVITGVEGMFCGTFDIPAIRELQAGKAQALTQGYVAVEIFTDTIVIPKYQPRLLRRPHPLWQHRLSLSKAYLTGLDSFVIS